MQSAVVRALHSCLSLDMFAYEGQLVALRGPVYSAAGFGGSIAFMVLLAGFVVSSMVAFLITPPEIVIQRFPNVGEHRIDMRPMCINVPKLNDAGYWNYSIEHVHSFSNGTKVRTPIRSVTAVDNDTLCVSKVGDDNFNLQGHCRPKASCSYVSFRLFACPVVATNETVATCHSLQEIGDILETNYVRVDFDTVLGTIRLNAVPKIVSQTLYNCFFFYNRTVQGPNYFTSFKTKQWVQLISDDFAYNLMDVYREESPARETLQLKVLLGSTWALAEETPPQTLIDLVSTWSAAGTLLFAIFCRIFRRVNERSFFRAWPLWERIDKNFETVPLNVENRPRQLSGARRRAMSTGRRDNAPSQISMETHSFHETTTDQHSARARESLDLMTGNI